MTRLRTAAGLIAIAAVTAAGGHAGATRVAAAPEVPLVIDHYVRVQSTVPSMSGQIGQLYVRERTLPGVLSRTAGLDGRVVLFVHGAGTPAEVAFDVPSEGYSWMAYLAQAGFDVFAMDLTGYGRSTRPAVMNDPCNLSSAQQAVLVPALIAAPCAARESRHTATIASEWHDIDAVVDYIRSRRRVSRVSLIGWSMGGPRTGGYAAQHPDKIDKLVLLAPVYSPTAAGAPATPMPANGPAFNTQSRAEFDANWDRQIECADQYDPAVRDAVWTEMLASDPVGATWGSGVRRAPQTTIWGWNRSMAAAVKAPTLLIAGVHDVQVPPAGVVALHGDLGTAQKVFVDLGCSSHNALWERHHRLLFQASREWLERGSVNGASTGTLKMGYAQ